jgi:hypothetical protein
MELLCPNCQQKLNIPEQYAGQLMRCPLCNGMFQAPSPGGAPPPPPPQFPPVSPEPFYSGATAPPPPAPAAPPMPPGELTKCCTLVISPRVVPWIAPLGLGLVLLLTFLPWVPILGLNAWNSAFGDAPPGLFRRAGGSSLLLKLYLIFLLLTLVLAIPSFLFSANLVPTPAGLSSLGPWRSLIVGVVAFLSFAFGFIEYVSPLFQHGITPWLICWRISTWVYFFVLIGFVLEFWLECRRQKNLPPPQIQFHR